MLELIFDSNNGDICNRFEELDHTKLISTHRGYSVPDIFAELKEGAFHLLEYLRYGEKEFYLDSDGNLWLGTDSDIATHGDMEFEIIL